MRGISTELHVLRHTAGEQQCIMDKESRGDPAFPHSTNYNYYSGSSHLQQFPYYKYSMPLDYSSRPPYGPGSFYSTEPVYSDANGGTSYHGPGSYSAESVSDVNSAGSDEDDC